MSVHPSIFQGLVEVIRQMQGTILVSGDARPRWRSVSLGGSVSKFAYAKMGLAVDRLELAAAAIFADEFSNYVSTVIVEMPAGPTSPLVPVGSTGEILPGIVDEKQVWVLLGLRHNRLPVVQRRLRIFRSMVP
jgi:hypothetical protein